MTQSDQTIIPPSRSAPSSPSSRKDDKHGNKFNPKKKCIAPGEQDGTYTIVLPTPKWALKKDFWTFKNEKLDKWLRDAGKDLWPDFSDTDFCQMTQASHDPVTQTSVTVVARRAGNTATKTRVGKTPHVKISNDPKVSTVHSMSNDGQSSHEASQAASQDPITQTYTDFDSSFNF